MTGATTAEANATLIKNAYDAFSRGDIPGAFAVFAEDILWHVPGRARCPVTIEDMARYSVSSSDSWSYPPVRSGFR